MALDRDPGAPKPPRRGLKALSVAAALFTAAPASALAQGEPVNYNRAERSVNYVTEAQGQVDQARNAFKTMMQTFISMGYKGALLERQRGEIRERWRGMLSDLKKHYEIVLPLSGYTSNSREMQQIERICDSNNPPPV